MTTKQETLTITLMPSKASSTAPLQTIVDTNGNAVLILANPIRVEFHEGGKKTCDLTTAQFNALLAELRKNVGGELTWKDVDGSKIATAPTTPGRLKALCAPKEPFDL